MSLDGTVVASLQKTAQRQHVGGGQIVEAILLFHALTGQALWIRTS